MRAAAPEISGAAVLLLCAHVHLETALNPWCYNLGNWKAPTRFGHDFCMFRCGEEVPLNAAEAMRAKAPDQIQFRGGSYSRDGKTMQSIIVLPPHEWSRFRAWESLEAGAVGFSDGLRAPKWAAAWAALFRADTQGYSTALHKAGYFTADDRLYSRILTQRVDLMRGLLLARKVLSLGSKGTAVEEWQRVVVAKVDGDFGRETERSTKLWQRSRGLVADGVVGPMSWARALPNVEVIA
ncbi:MAG: peptidoglycan-binding domain-containing protein [Giesbergeria sp.]